MIKTGGFTALENVDLSDVISLVAPTDTPFLTLLMRGNKYSKALSTIINWREKSLSLEDDTSAVEGAAAESFVASTRAEKNNVQEIFVKNIAISGSALASDVKGISDLMKEEVNDRLIEIAVALEKKLLNGEKKDGSKTPFKRQMDGLLKFAHENNHVVTAEVTEAKIKDTVKKLWDNGLGTGEFVALVNADIKEEIDKLYEGKYHYVAQEDKFGLVVTTIQTNYGNIKLILDRHMEDDEMVIFDPAFVELSYLRTPQFAPLGKVGDSERAQVLAEASLKVYNEKAVAVLTVDDEHVED